MNTKVLICFVALIGTRATSGMSAHLRILQFEQESELKNEISSEQVSKQTRVNGDEDSSYGRIHFPDEFPDQQSSDETTVIPIV